MPKLGMLANYCYDNLQELPKCAEKLKLLGIDFPFKTQQEMSDMADNMGRYVCAAAYSNGGKMTYNLQEASALEIGGTMEKILYARKLLQEIQKDEPDYESFLLTGDQRGDIIKQIDTLSDFQELFGKNDNVDMDVIEKEDVIKLASMASEKFLADNNITYDCARTPVTVTKTATFSVGFTADMAKGKVLEHVISRNGRQIVKTNVPARMDKYLQTFEKKNLRGKEKDNSPEFNTLLKNYDETIKNLREKNLSNVDSRKEMEALKKAASDYLTAKRAQKGYQTEKTVDKNIDDKMLGKEKGKSGKRTERYGIPILTD